MTLMSDMEGFKQFAEANGRELQNTMDDDGQARYRALGMVTSLSRAAYPRGQMRCPRCADVRTMDVRAIWTPPNFPDGRPEPPPTLGGPPQGPGPPIPRSFSPALLEAHCTQCQAGFTLVTCDGPNGPDIVVLPRALGTGGTPNTPGGVAYYLDQADRARTLGARSAAVAMYRSAVEMMLFEQGYRTGMLGKKIEALEADKATGAGPFWVKDVDAAVLIVLKDLGNAAIHPNDGDVKRQQALDEELLIRIEETMRGLLVLVYEVPATRQAALSTLQAGARKMTP